MPTIPRCNDGSGRPPRLRLDLNWCNLGDLPAHSTVPGGPAKPDLAAIAALGFEGLQGDIATARAVGMRATASGRINGLGEVAGQAKGWKDAGYDLATVHVGWGHEDDATIDTLVREIIAVSADTGLPILIETHRATITQDSWRTVRMVERNPEVRFNGDFSHWYTGLEWPYGDVEAKLAFIAPVLERVRFFHGRVGNSSHIQLPWEHPSMPAAVAHLREFWTRSMVGFLRDARPGDYLPFTPELLTHAWNYAPLVPVGRDRWVECGDRWADALAMAEAAKGCWVEAQRRLGR